MPMRVDEPGEERASLAIDLMLDRPLQFVAVDQLLDLAIVADDQAQNTIQNIRNSQAIMAAHGWHTAILVTEPYHINRAALIARDAGLPAVASPALDSPDWRDPWSRVWHVERETLSLMLYQVKQVLDIHY